MEGENNAASPRTGEVRPVRMNRKEASRYLKDHHGLTVAPDTLAKRAIRGDGRSIGSSDARRSIPPPLSTSGWRMV